LNRYTTHTLEKIQKFHPISIHKKNQRQSTYVKDQPHRRTPSPVAAATPAAGPWPCHVGRHVHHASSSTLVAPRAALTLVALHTRGVHAPVVAQT
jgi:hypothetical protein